MIPLQLSPVDTLKRVRKAMPKLSKVAWRLRPSQGFSSEHSARGSRGGEERHRREKKEEGDGEERRKSFSGDNKLRSTTK